MSTENKALGRRFFDEYNQGNLDAITTEVLAENVVVHQPGVPGPLDRDAYRQFGEMFRAAFPDLQIVVADEIAEGDTVVYRTIARGTHEGDLQGIPPTGKQVEISGISIIRVAGGRIVERWDQYDMLGMMQQLGVVPTPE